MTGLDLLHARDPDLAAGVRHLAEAAHGRHEYGGWAFANIPAAAERRRTGPSHAGNPGSAERATP